MTTRRQDMHQADIEVLTNALKDAEAREGEASRAFAIVASGTNIKIRRDGTVLTYGIDVYQRAIEETWLGNGSMVRWHDGTLAITGPDGKEVSAAKFSRYCAAQGTLAAVAETLIDYISELHRKHPELRDEIVDVEDRARTRRGMRGGGWEKAEGPAK